MIDQNVLKEKLGDFKWAFYYEEPCHILAIMMASHSRTKFIQETIGTKLTALLNEINDKMFKIYTNPEEEKRTAKIILEKILNEPDFFEEVQREVKNKSDQLLAFSRTLKDRDYEKLSNKDLLDLYLEFMDRFIAMRNYSSIPTLIEHTTNTFTNLLKDKLKGIISNEEELERVFTTLTSPDRLSYVSREDLEISKLALKFLDNNKEWTEDLDKLLDEHTLGWTWLDYTFDGIPITKEQFRLKAEKKASNNDELKVKIEKYESISQKIKKDQEDTVAKHQLDDETVRMLSYGKEMVWIKFFRKGTFAESYYNSEFFLSEIAKRLSTSMDVIKFMFDWEVEDALLGKKVVDQKEILSRIKHSFVLGYEGDFLEITDPDLLETVQKNIIDEEVTDQKELKGQAAYVGEATGKVRIINDTPDMAKMEQGDILVSRSTNPKLFPAMKLASAFVTDAGGLTCHAAIVARELKVPCVVGTVHATKVFKDGDVVRVSATKGLVQLIEKGSK